MRRFYSYLDIFIPIAIFLDLTWEDDYGFAMNEYVLSVKSEAPSDWMDQVSSNPSVVVRGGTISHLLIKCSEEIVEKLKKESTYLKVEYVCPHFKDEQKNEK